MLPKVRDKAFHLMGELIYRLVRGAMPNRNRDLNILIERGSLRLTRIRSATATDTAAELKPMIT